MAQNIQINLLPNLIIKPVARGGQVFSMLATVFKVRGFKPGRGLWDFKGDKNS
jgi:hypothetical protein